LNASDLTRDTFFDGRLVVTQTIGGYRFSIDAVLLAAGIRPKPGDTLLDLGAGCGIISLILASRFPQVRIHAVELQPELIELAQDNVADNHMGDRIEVVQADLRVLPREPVTGPFDWIVSNPPYHRPDSGRINPNQQRALARHEIAMDLSQLLACARRMLRTGGRLALIYPAERSADLLVQMRQEGIEPKYLQGVHSQSGQAARLVIVHGIHGARPGLCLAAPLVIYAAHGEYTDVVREMMQP
jgi:tRNA1Val (adenine37-N6)-methyltransferase